MGKRNRHTLKRNLSRRRGGFLSPTRWARQGHNYMRKKYNAMTSYLPSWQRVKERTRSIFSNNRDRREDHEDQERLRSYNNIREDMESARYGGK